MIAHVRLGKILLNKIAAVIVRPKLGTIIQTSDVVMLIMPQLQFYESVDAKQALEAALFCENCYLHPTHTMHRKI